MSNIKTYRRGNLTLVLDKNRVIKDDPGADTPAMVYLMENNRSVASATYWCACGEGVLTGDSHDYELKPNQITWLESLDRELTDFLYRS